MKCRKNVKDLTPAEKTNIVNAFLALKNAAAHPSTLADAQADGALSRYDDFVWMHMVVGMGAHKGPAFLPWHREFLICFLCFLFQILKLTLAVDSCLNRIVSKNRNRFLLSFYFNPAVKFKVIGFSKP